MDNNDSKDGHEQQEMVPLTETGNISRGGLKQYSDVNRKTTQRVRGEFVGAVFRPKVTFAYDSLTFNTSCVNLFPGQQHIVLNIDEVNQRVIIEPCQSFNRDSLKFANIDIKKDRNKSRKCVTREFCLLLYEMMGWNTSARYRCMAIYQDFGDKQIMVFNLDECLQVFSEMVETSDGKKKRNTTINMPADWKDRFGYTLEEIDARYKVDRTTTLITVDNKTGERYASHIQPKLPTPEELMHRPYGGIRARQEVDDDE